MRQVLSTALVAVIVGALAGVTAGTLAQAEPGSAVAPAARAGNADRVDGKHAVAYTNKRGVRAGKLVATNGQGLLPSNIVQPYWGYIRNKPGILADHQIGWSEVQDKPGILADHQIGWGEVQNKPAGFADGVDDTGPTYTSQIVANETNPLAAGGTRTIMAWFDRNIDVVYNLIPTTNYGHLTLAYEFYQVDGDVIHIAIVKNIGSDPVTFKVRALLFSEGVKPAALKRAVKTAKVVVQQGRRSPR